MGLGDVGGGGVKHHFFASVILYSMSTRVNASFNDRFPWNPGAAAGPVSDPGPPAAPGGGGPQRGQDAASGGLCVRSGLEETWGFWGPAEVPGSPVAAFFSPALYPKDQQE